jgi:hypothetical protein
MKYDIKFPARTYKVQGVDKTYWTTHGTLWVDDKTQKMTIQLDSLPLYKDFTGKMWVFEQSEFAPKNDFGGASRDGLPDDDLVF